MKFKVLNAHKDKGVLLVSGVYTPEKGEEEVLSVLRDTLAEVNKTVDGTVQCDRFVSNDKTILFKSIPIDTAFSVLHLQNDSFNLHLKVVMGKNMQSNSLKPEIEQYFRVHKL